MKRILVMGLPGSGKTTFANALCKILPNSVHLNADEIRKQYDDWDFSIGGRMRQSIRMYNLAKETSARFAIADFVCPLPEMRQVYKPDWTIWMDTVDESSYEDTNRMFVDPEKYDYRLTKKNGPSQLNEAVISIASDIYHDQRKSEFDFTKPTVMLLGRYQPWHDGHRTLFERALKKTGQVMIQVRDMPRGEKNPLTYEQVARRIRRDLDPMYYRQYEIMRVPNIVNITYGRDVGYVIEKETLDAEIEAISATAIRAQMNK